MVLFHPNKSLISQLPADIESNIANKTSAGFIDHSCWTPVSEQNIY